MIEHDLLLPNFTLIDNLAVNPSKSFNSEKSLRTWNFNFLNRTNYFQKLRFSDQYFVLSQLFSKIQRNTTSILILSKKIDDMEDAFSQIHTKLSIFEKDVPPYRKQDKESVKLDSRNINIQKKKSKLHYKDLFRQITFGSQQYKFKLNIEGKAPQLLFKQRNLSLKICLVDLNQNRIENQNAISLHLRVFYTNGEEIENTTKGESFMKGPLNCTLIYGKAHFDKIYPREVSRKLGKKKIVLVIYASGMGSTILQCPSRADPVEIEPLIIYGVKVVTKQNKDRKPKKQEMESEECESQFTV